MNVSWEERDEGEERVREVVERMPEYQLRATAPDGRVFVWVPSPYGGGSWAGPLRDIDPAVASFIGELLDRDEGYAADYHADHDDWRAWAGRIDKARAAIGLPLAERTVINVMGLPDLPRPMTLLESLELQWARDEVEP